MGKIRIKDVFGKDIVIPDVKAGSTLVIENIDGFDFTLPLNRTKLRNMARTQEHMMKRRR